MGQRHRVRLLYCGPGYFPAVTAEQRTTSDWHRAWNAGVGWQVAIPERSIVLHGSALSANYAQ